MEPAGTRLKNLDRQDNSDVPEYHAAAGSEVGLPCGVAPPSTEDGVALVLWYRGDSGEPVLSLDARSGPPGTQTVSPALGSRASLRLTPRSAELLIRPVLGSDQAEYRCRVDFRRGRTQRRVMRLFVSVPPKQIFIVDSSNHTVAQKTSPVKEGDRLELACHAVGGRPAPEVTWWRDGKVIDATYRVTAPERVVNSLELTRVSRTDLMAALTCRASNSNLTRAASARVELDMLLRPLDVRLEGTVPQLSAGQAIEVSCRSTGSRPPARLTWLRGEAEPARVDPTTGASYLTLVPVPEDHGRKLRCRARNPSLPADTALEASWTMEVLFPPQVSLAMGASTQHQHLREGDDVYFECNVAANPHVTHVEWALDGRTLAASGSDVVLRNRSLLLRDVRRSHRGRYRCSARNAEGQGLSDPVLLRVQFAPVCKAAQPDILRVAPLQPAVASCDVEADPPEITFRWAFNATSSAARAAPEYDGPSARLVPQSRLDYGVLYCWGENAVGTQAEPCAFHVIPTAESKSISISTGAILSILMGVLLILAFLSYLVFCLLRLRSHRPRKGKNPGISDKLSTPIRKNFEEETPDVIPLEFTTGFPVLPPHPKFDVNEEKLIENICKHYSLENLSPNILLKTDEDFVDLTYRSLHHIGGPATSPLPRPTLTPSSLRVTANEPVAVVPGTTLQPE